MKHINKLLAIVSLCLLPNLAWLEPSDAIDPLALSGGSASVADASELAYSRTLPTLDAKQLEQFALGRRMFNNRWAFFWFENAEFGRGPTSNAQACTICHANNGRGIAPGVAPRLPADAEGEARDHHIPVPFEPALNLVLRISLPGQDAHGGPKPHQHYGEQLQNFGVKGVVAAEGSVSVQWEEQFITLADGEKVGLRKPVIAVNDLAYGELEKEVMLAPRMPPALVGMGLLDAISEQTILDLAARKPVDGIRGKANRVWDASQKQTVLGRFGLKANHGSLREQVAAAFLQDLGLSTPVYVEQNCPPIQVSCKEQLTAGTRLGFESSLYLAEITPLRLESTELYLRALAVPMRRNIDDPVAKRGEQLFAQARCAVCHVPELKTGPYPAMPQLANQTIRPYTDLLLHDMGEQLADNRPDYLASGSEWRTPPLWGIGLSETVNGGGAFLHDGRARNFTEAILWHGGEAEISQRAFRALPREDRGALVAFLQSL